jgi:lipoprotein-anchoring transpeptidase ErfK/SrfK
MIRKNALPVAPRANISAFRESSAAKSASKVNTSPATSSLTPRNGASIFVEPNGYAIRYGIGVGRAGFQWGGVHKVTAKKENSDWTPPPQMRARQKGLPAFIKGGDENNPLGVRAMYLGSTLYRIHGSNDPESIGEAESSGCFRMTNEDVKHLYERVPIGTTVYVLLH